MRHDRDDARSVRFDELERPGRHLVFFPRGLAQAARDPSRRERAQASLDAGRHELEEASAAFSKREVSGRLRVLRLPLVAEKTFRRLDHPELLPEVAMGAQHRNGIRLLPVPNNNPDQEAAA